MVGPAWMSLSPHIFIKNLQLAIFMINSCVSLFLQQHEHLVDRMLKLTTNVSFCPKISSPRQKTGRGVRHVYLIIDSSLDFFFFFFKL